MNAAADQLLRLVEELLIAGQAMAIQECIDRIPRPPARTVITGRHSSARQSGVAEIQPTEDRLRSVVHVDDPLSQSDGRFTRLRIAGEKIVEHEAGGVVVLIARSSTA